MADAKKRVNVGWFQQWDSILQSMNRTGAQTTDSEIDWKQAVPWASQFGYVYMDSKRMRMH